MAESILEEAIEITEGARQETYGHPLDNFTREAAMASAYLSDKLRPGVTIDADDIPMLDIIKKVARQAHLRRRDNLVDIAGYASCAHRVEAERAARGRKEKASDEATRVSERRVVIRGPKAGNGLRVYGAPENAPIRGNGVHAEGQSGPGPVGEERRGPGTEEVLVPRRAVEGCGCRACETRREAKAAGEGVQV